MGKIRKPEEVATIDASLIVLTPESGDGDAIGITTNTEVATEVQTETTDANKLIIKGVLKAQKKEKQTLTGIQLTLTDNMTVLDLAKAVQGGTILRDDQGRIIKYTPPIIGEDKEQEKYTVDVYSACMDSSGEIIKYEKTTYKHCTGQPFAYNAADDTWRSAQYVLLSLPKQGEPPYEIEYVDELPEVEDVAEVVPELGSLTVNSAAGSSVGHTIVTVTPEKAVGNSYKYKTAASVNLPSYNQDCSSGYQDWDGTAEIAAVTGNQILIVEVTADSKARAAGIGTVTAMSDAGTQGIVGTAEVDKAQVEK